MHSALSLGGPPLACPSGESPNTPAGYTDFAWCSGPSPEEAYNENYVPSEMHSSQNVQQYYEFHPHHTETSANAHHHPHHFVSPNEIDDCCSAGSGGAGEFYGGGVSRSPSTVTYVWDTSHLTHDPSPDNPLSPSNPPRTGKRRTTANKKERRRTQSINNAFAELRDCIPNVPADTKLSKIKTLRLATSYIAYLSDVLSGDDPSRTPAAFTAEISRKLARSDEKRKKELLMAELNATNCHGGTSDRKSKGRTGWPQHVWALELQQ